MLTVVKGVYWLGLPCLVLCLFMVMYNMSARSIYNRPTSSGVVQLPRCFEFLPQQAGLKHSRGSRRFTPYKVTRKSTSTMTWTHKFVCLADSAQDDVPGAADKHKLKCADLGEKKMLRLDGKYADIKDACLSCFREGRWI